MEHSRSTIFIGAIIVAIGILGAQLFWLQVWSGDQFEEISEGNAVRMARVLPARGAIYDRHGSLLVDNKPTYTITLTPRYFDVTKTTHLAALLEVPDSVVTAKLNEARGWNSYRPSPSFRDIPFEIYGRIRENAFLLPGVGHEIAQGRRYASAAQAAHVLGYLREINERELAGFQEQGNALRYRQGDVTGKIGVERGYEKELRGTPGSAWRVVNVHGLDIKSYLGGEEDAPPLSGYDIHLAMDAGVQALAESLFVNKRGAAMAMDVVTGGIIALVSMPDFDPSIFARTLDHDTWTYLNTSADKPLHNRATMNRMPPGSTWKPFMSLMALQEGLIQPEGFNSTYLCPGYHPVGRGRIFRCLGAHGRVDVQKAIRHSCNTFFFELARRMDVNTFRDYANMFGFGVEAPTDITEQTPGIIPDSAYFNAIDPYWDIGYSMNLGIGQGDMGVTPLQLVRYVAAVANGGVLHAPHMVDSLRNSETGETRLPDLPESVRVPIDVRYFEIVREGMRMVMEDGTGRVAQIPDILSGGKTGTAQAPGRRRDHSVFIMFAPFDDPKIALAVQCENAGDGSACAAPIASLMAELYLKGHLPDTPQTRIRMRRALMAESEALPDENSGDAE